MPPLPKWKAGPFLIDISNRDEMYHVFDKRTRRCARFSPAKTRRASAYPAAASNSSPDTGEPSR